MHLAGNHKRKEKLKRDFLDILLSGSNLIREEVASIAIKSSLHKKFILCFVSKNIILVFFLSIEKNNNEIFVL